MNGQAQAVDTFTEDLDESFTADSNEFQGQQEQSPPPTPQWEIPYEPPVQPARDPYDDVPAWVEEAGNRFRETLAEERLYTRVQTAEARAIEVHNGKDGLPSYSELVDHYAIPLMRERPDLRRLVLSQDDPAAASFLVGFCAAYPHLISQVVARNGQIDKSIFRSTNFRPTVRGQGSERRQPSGKVNYENWDNESFIAELDRFKLSSEGE
jgi:hypothetical protein